MMCLGLVVPVFILPRCEHLKTKGQAWTKFYMLCVAEVALDYNAGLTTALAGLIAAPPAFWAQNCTEYLPKYPW